jgi:hypothetical protein
LLDFSTSEDGKIYWKQSVSCNKRIKKSYLTLISTYFQFWICLKRIINHWNLDLKTWRFWKENAQEIYYRVWVVPTFWKLKFPCTFTFSNRKMSEPIDNLSEF